MASSDSSTAASMKPQVLTTTTSAGSYVGRDLVAFRAQLREDALGIHQRLGAAEADEADLGDALGAFGAAFGGGGAGGHGAIPGGAKPTCRPSPPQ